MPSLTKREMAKIQKRLEFMHEKLGGKKITPSGDGTQDEFTSMQMFISEEIVALRNKIEKQKKAEKKKELYIESLKLKKELERDILELEDNLDKMRVYMERSKDNPNLTQQAKQTRSQIYNKFEEIVSQLRRVLKGEEIDLTPFKKPVSKLADLKGEWKTNNTAANETSTAFGQDHYEDDNVIQGWAKTDQEMDNKLGDINMLLDEMRVMNDNLKNNIYERENLINVAQGKAEKTGKEIEIQNKGLAAILKKYRSPGQLCMDVCLFFLVLGLVAVIITLIVNGKL